MKETGVTIEATIKIRFTSYGLIEQKLREGEDVTGYAEAIVDDIIDCCGIAGEDMRVESVEYELNE